MQIEVLFVMTQMRACIMSEGGQLVVIRNVWGSDEGEQTDEVLTVEIEWLAGVIRGETDSR